MKAISKAVSITLLIFSILFLLYAIYRAEFHHLGTRSGYYLKYYIISFIFIFFSVVSFFINEDLKIKISTVLVATILSLYLIEAYLQITNKNLIRNKVTVKVKEYEKKTGKKIDIRNRFLIYQELKKKDPNVVVSLIPKNYLHENNQTIFPLSGISNSKTIFCNENGYMSIYQSDRYGFNNPDVEWNKKEIEFFLVGDSFTHGYCVNEPDTISGNLRSMLNQGGGVLNLGQGGNGPLIEYATLKEYLPIANTKRVLWIYYEGNDVKDTREESKNSFLSNYLNDINFSQDLKSKQKKINQNLFIKLQLQINLERIRNPVIKFLILTELRSSTIEKLFLIFNASPTPLNPGYEELERNIFLEFEKIIKLSKELSEKNEAKFYFVYLPDFSRYLDNSKNNNKEFYNYQKVVQTINNLNVKIIDLNTDLFSDHPDFKSLFSHRNGHYNELGYRLVAKTIFKKIREYENIK